MSDTIPTYGYNAKGEAEIFHLKPGEKLPAGWADTPAAFDKPAKPQKPKSEKGK